ncbi:MAG: ribbon-helix-helix protein, CopG family [Pseudomonadota bacterium]
MARKKTKPATKEAEIKIRLSSDDKALFEEAARRRGLSVSAWLRMLALDAARPPGAQH